MTMDKLSQITPPINETPTKCCTGCGLEHPLTNFHKRKASKDGLALVCKDCARRYCRENSARRTARAHEWNKSNSDKVTEYRKENREVIRSNARISDNRRRTDPAQREKEAASRRRWYESGGFQIESDVHRRYYERKKENGGELTAEEWSALIGKYGSRCVCCGSEGPLEADHIVPVSKGGGNSVNNRQPLCRSCNARKGDQSIDYRPDRANLT